MTDLTADAIDTIETLALKGAEPRYLSDLNLKNAVALVPKELAPLDLEPYLSPKPSSFAEFDEAESFIEYINRYKEESTVICMVWSDWEWFALIDYHEPAMKKAEVVLASDSDAADEILREEGVPFGANDSGTTRKCQHFAHLKLEKSPEYKDWEKVFNNWVFQEEFAEWLEDYAHHFAEPTAAEIFTIVRELHVAQDVTYTSHKRESDGGYDFQYTDNSKGTAGEFSVPSEIVLAFPLFFNGEPHPIHCKLRYRMSNGKVKFCIRPLRLLEEIRDSLQAVRHSISDGTDIFVHSGNVFKEQLSKKKGVEIGR